MDIIKGTQSTIYIDRNSGIVKKVSTTRGIQDTIDQIKFYSNLPESMKHMFPRIIEYSYAPEYYYTYPLITGKNLREILLDGEINLEWLDKLIFALREIHQSIHSYQIDRARFHDIYNTYISRCINRVAETRNLLKNRQYILDLPILINGILVKEPITRIIHYFEANIHSLVPSYICSTHGQLGPSHIFLSRDSNEFTLIDPKGFDVFYDPIIDLCKIGKAMLYATEWLEENKYQIDYNIAEDKIIINNFTVENYNLVDMKNYYNCILNSLEISSDENAKRRVYSMIYADLIGGLPFAFAADGEKRLIALLSQIALASLAI